MRPFFFISLHLSVLKHFSTREERNVFRLSRTKVPFFPDYDAKISFSAFTESGATNDFTKADFFELSPSL